MPEGIESLSQHGLCSGDTLWVLGTVEGDIPAAGLNSAPAGPSPTAAAQAVSSSSGVRPQEDSTGSKRTRQDGALAKDEESLVKPGAPLIALTNSVGGITAQQSDCDGMNGTRSDLVSGSSPCCPMDASTDEAAPCARNELSAVQAVPGHLKRVLSASVSDLSPERTEADGPVFSPHALILAAAHAAMLETGFLPYHASAYKLYPSSFLIMIQPMMIGLSMIQPKPVNQICAGHSNQCCPSSIHLPDDVHMDSRRGEQPCRNNINKDCHYHRHQLRGSRISLVISTSSAPYATCSLPNNSLGYRSFPHASRFGR